MLTGAAMEGASDDMFDKSCAASVAPFLSQLTRTLD